MFATQADKLDMKTFYRYQVEVVNRFGEMRNDQDNRREVIYQVSKNFKFHMAFDGSRILFTNGKLTPVPALDIKDFIKSGKEESKMTQEEHDRLATLEKDPTMISYVVDGIDGRKYKAMVMPVECNELNKGQLLQIAMAWSFWITGKEDKGEKVIIRYSSIFPSSSRRQLGKQSVLLTGTFQSFRQTQAGLYLNTDLSYFVSSWFGTLIEYMSVLLRMQESSWINAIMKDNKLQQAINSTYGGFNNLSCTVTYSKRKFKVSGIDFKTSAAKHTFDHDGKAITVQAYLKLKYNYTVRFPTLALAYSEKANKEVTYMPIECLVIPSTKYNQDLSTDERTAMIDMTRAKPADKLDLIKKNQKILIENGNWTAFQVGLSPNPTEVTAQVLRPQALAWKGDKEKQLSDLDEEKGWRFGQDFDQVHTTTKLERWAVVSFVGPSKPEVQEFCQALMREAKGMGLFMGVPALREANEGGRTTPNAYKKILEEFAKLKAQFVLVLLEDKLGDCYRAVKRSGDVLEGIMSKCVVMDSERKWTDSNIMKNILASVNGRIGGKNWVISQDQMKRLGFDTYSKEGLCLLGMDVCHGKTFRKDQSVVALCTSYDRDFCNYATSMLRLDSGQELLEQDQMKKLIVEGLQQYKLANNRLPLHLLFWRDGVGEGQYSLVRDKELLGIRSAIQELYATAPKQPKLTYVIIQKRNHLRSFYCFNSEVYNPPVGTVIHTEIVDKDLTNFYMYSHKAVQGTARPTHYQLLVNELGLSVEKLAGFSFAAAHLHQGCNKPVSVPAPAIRAHKAALRGYAYFEDKSEPHQLVKNKSFML